MAEIQKDFLFALVKSLSKSEKRQFRIFVNRLGINVEAKFLLLFEALDKMETYDEALILERKITTKQQLSNLKAHLYKQILISLRTNPSNVNNRMQIREQLDFATILYNRGLYKQSLKILDKTKQLSLELEEKDIAFEIVELEKIIESQYITRSIASRADDLILDAEKISRLNALNSKLSNLSLKLYSMMLANGYAKTEKEQQNILHFFEKNLPTEAMSIAGFREKLWFYKAHIWKNMLVQNYKYAYKNALSLVGLFYERPEMIGNNPVWFMKSFSYLFNTLFILRKSARFDYWLKQFTNTVAEEHLQKNANLEALIFTTMYKARINSAFLNGNYAEAGQIINEIQHHKEFYDDKIDIHHIHILYFKMASLNFGNQNYGACIDELNKIINDKSVSVREDLNFYSRILSIMAMMDSGQDEHLFDFLEDTHAFYKKMKYKTDFQASTMRIFSEFYKHSGSYKGDFFENYLNDFKQLRSNPFNVRNFVYLDIISWLEAKVRGEKVSEIIRKKSI